MSLFRPRDPAARRRIFVLPYAGGGTADFRRWPAPDGVEIVPAELPAREAKLSQPPYTDFATLVRDLLRDLPTDRPYALYGHSLGAWIAYEMVHGLVDAGRDLPWMLGVGARQAPRHENSAPPLGRLSREDFVAGMIERYDAIPRVLLDRPELLDAFLPAVRADVTLFEDYRWTDREPLDIPIHVFLGDEDATVEPAQARDWALHTSAPCDVTVLGGGHFFHREHGTALLDALT